MEAQNLLPGSGGKIEALLRQRIKSCFAPREFNAESFRGVAMGMLMATVIADAVLFHNLKTSLKYGQMPWYTMDVVIVLMAGLEAVASPLWAWFTLRRRTALMTSCLLPAVIVFAFLAMPSVPSGSGSEFCASVGPTPELSFMSMSTAASFRLVIIVVVAVCNVVSRAATWNLSIGMLDEGKPEDMPLNYGILVAVRVLTMIMMPKVLGPEMATWMQTAAVTPPLLLHALQLPRVSEPLPDPNKPVDETSFFSSFSRIVSSWQAVGQIVAMALLVSALWGFGWHETEIMKLRYFIVEARNFKTNQLEFLFYHGLILAVVCYGLFYSRPIFDRVSAVKLATFAALLVTPLYCVQTMLLSCEHGAVGGLSNNYTQPACSNDCRCAMPWSGFSPVCVTDSLTTYMSPCHAGCMSTDTIAGLPVLRGCACAPSAGLQRATPGACSAGSCQSSYFLHKGFTATIVIITVLALQVQLVFLLRTVQPRDRRLAVGLATSCTLLSAFVCSHLIYFAIQVKTCAWHEGGQCQFHSQTFANAVGGTSTSLAGISFVISLVTWKVLSKNRPKAEEIAPLRENGNVQETHA